MAPGVDAFIIEFDRALRSIAGSSPKSRPTPVAASTNEPLSDAQKKHAAGLMRVHHVGEVCAQALYQSQKMYARDHALKQKLEQAGIEEEDHLAWCAERLQELDSRPSLLNPFWYAGAFVLGSLAGMAGDKVSLGFVALKEGGMILPKPIQTAMKMMAKVMTSAAYRI